MTSTTFRPLIPPVGPENYTELLYRLDERSRGVIGQYDIAPENTLAFDLSRDELYSRVESMVGNTPLIHVEDVGDSTILAKVESQNPTENHYDRVFPKTIKKLEDDGVIAPGDELIEVTSGSGGRAFAWAARVLGYRARLIIPPELPAARVQDMINFGAELEVTEPGYMQEVSRAYVERIKNLEEAGLVTKIKTPDYVVFAGTDESGKRVCFVNHSSNEITVEGFDSIGKEIHDQLPVEQPVDFVVSVMGNGTSTVALSRTMRDFYPGVTIVGLEDERSPHYFAQKHPGEYERRFGHQVEFTPHDMFGSSAPGVRLKYGDVDVVDEVRLANPTERDSAQEAYNRSRPSFEKIGKSSAASLVEARKLAQQHPGSTIVIVFYDKADQYGENPKIAPRYKFMYDRPRPNDVPPRGWRQKRVGSIALLPDSLTSAYRN